jgi:hypothetical protein
MRRARQSTVPPVFPYQTWLVRFALTFQRVVRIIVQRGINATVSSRSLAGYRFFFHRAGLRSCRPLLPGHQAWQPGILTFYD